MSTHNICFYRELEKIIIWLSQNTLLICSSGCVTDYCPLQVNIMNSRLVTWPPLICPHPHPGPIFATTVLTEPCPGMCGVLLWSVSSWGQTTGSWTPAWSHDQHCSVPIPTQTQFSPPQYLLNPVLGSVVCCSNQYPLEVKQQSHELPPGHVTSTDLFPCPIQPIPVCLY